MVHFNGINLSSYINITDVKREILAEQIVNLNSVAGMIGSYISDVKLGSKKFDIEFYIDENTKEEVRSKLRDLASILHTTKEVSLWFEDEPNLEYQAIFSGTSSIDEIVKYGNGTLTFIAPQGISYGSLVSENIDLGSVASTFTRNSQGYDAYGNLVNINVPKYAPSRSGKGMLIEDAISNPILNSATFDGCEFEIRNVDIQNVRISNGTLYYDFTKGASSDIRFHMLNIEITKGVEYVYSFDLFTELGSIKMIANGTATDNFSSGKEIGTIDATGNFTGIYGTKLINKRPLGGGWHRYNILLPDSYFAGSGTTCEIEHQHGWSYVGAIKYQFRKPMLSVGNKVRKYTPITMAEDKYTLEINTLRDNGCIEHQFYIDATMIPTITDSFRNYVWSIQDVTNVELVKCYLFRGKIHIENVNKDVVAFDATEGWHTIGIKFDSGKTYIVFDGVSGDHGLVTPIQDIQRFILGSTPEWGSINTVHDTIRLSDKSKTIADLIATGNTELGVEPATSELFRFDGNLSSDMSDKKSVIVLDVIGTLPTYPIITIKLLQSIDTLFVYHNEVKVIEIKYSFKSGDTIIIDNELNNVTINGINKLKHMTLDSSFVEFLPTRNSVSINKSVPGNIKVEYKERWL